MGKIGLHGRIKEVEGIYNPKCNIVFTAVLSQISFPLTNTRFGLNFGLKKHAWVRKNIFCMSASGSALE